MTLSQIEQQRMAWFYERAVDGDEQALAVARELRSQIAERWEEDPGYRTMLRRRGGSPEGIGNGRHDLWTEAELRLLSDVSISTADVAWQTNRTIKAVQEKRRLVRAKAEKR